MIDTKDKKHAPEEDLSDDLFSHGTEERQRNFLGFFATCLNNMERCPALSSVDVFQLLSEVALEWPGDEDDEWGTIAGLAAYFFDEIETQKAANAASHEIPVTCVEKMNQRFRFGH